MYFALWDVHTNGGESREASSLLQFKCISAMERNFLWKFFGLVGFLQVRAVLQAVL